MKKTIKFLGISLVIAGILAIVLAGSVFAAGPQNNSNTSGAGYGGAGYGGGSTLDAVSKLLGMTEEQIQEQRQAGKSLVQIAATKNVTEDALVNAILADKKTALQELVTAGTITQAQADQRLEFMKRQVQQNVNRTSVGPLADRGNASGWNRNGNVNGSTTPGTCPSGGGMMRFGRQGR